MTDSVCQTGTAARFPERPLHAIGGRARGALVGLWLALLAAACVAPLPPPTTADLALARIDDPDTQLEDLERGRALYGKRCGSCHALRSPGEHPAEDWPAQVSRMETKHGLRLTPDDERDILRYLRAASSIARQPPSPALAPPPKSSS